MADGGNKWYKKVFGDELIDCKGLSNENVNVGNRSHVCVDGIFEGFYKVQGTRDQEEEEGELVVGVYFSPAEGIPDESANCLLELYKSLNGGENGCSLNSNVYENDFHVERGRKRGRSFLEVIHVLLTNPVHWLDRCTVDETKMLDRLKEYPWYAVPLGDKDRMIRLTRRYEIKSMTPSLVLLNGLTGQIITKHGRDRLLEDPGGSRFPWKPRPLHVVLENVELRRGGKAESNSPSTFENLKGFVVGFYFSAHWCPPCKGFTPQLVETYNLLKRVGANFEIVFVSSDRSPESHQTYLQTMPWLAVPYPEEDCRRELASLFGVQGIPTLVIVDSDGSVITCDGRGEINDDPTGQMFPWRPRPVNVLTERQSAKLQDAPAVVLFIEGEETEMEFAETVLTPAVRNFVELEQNDEVPLEFFIACDSETSDALREFIGIEDVVPLLTLINIPDGTWAALDDGTDLNEESVKEFVARFLRNDLPMQSICRDQKNGQNM